LLFTTASFMEIRLFNTAISSQEFSKIPENAAISQKDILRVKIENFYIHESSDERSIMLIIKIICHNYVPQYITVQNRYIIFAISHLEIIRNMTTVLFFDEGVSEKIRSFVASVKSLSRGARRDNSRPRDNIIVK